MRSMDYLCDILSLAERKLYESIRVLYTSYGTHYTGYKVLLLSVSQTIGFVEKKSKTKSTIKIIRIKKKLYEKRKKKF